MYRYDHFHLEISEEEQHVPFVRPPLNGQHLHKESRIRIDKASEVSHNPRILEQNFGFRI